MYADTHPFHPIVEEGFGSADPEKEADLKLDRSIGIFSQVEESVAQKLQLTNKKTANRYSTSKQGMCLKAQIALAGYFALLIFGKFEIHFLAA